MLTLKEARRNIQRVKDAREIYELEAYLDDYNYYTELAQHYYTAAEAAENENNDIAYRYFSRCSDNCSRIVHELEVAEAE